MMYSEIMPAYQAWNTIISKLTPGQHEFKTIPMSKREPVWFSASTDGTIIYIDQSKHHKPSSQLSMTRKLSYQSSFVKVYPLYFRRKSGEAVSKEAGAITVNQVYYYSLIHHLVDVHDLGKS